MLNVFSGSSYTVPTGALFMLADVDIRDLGVMVVDYTI